MNQGHIEREALIDLIEAEAEIIDAAWSEVMALLRRDDE